MAAFDTNRTTHGSFALIGRIGGLVAIAKTAVIGWNDARMTRNALLGLSSRELNDIGLSRGDIDDVALGNRRR